MSDRNWGLTDHELTTIPPSLVRSFTKGSKGGFGSRLPGTFGRVLMRDQRNSALYGPLQGLYEDGKEKGTDVWIHKNRFVVLGNGRRSELTFRLMLNDVRMSGLWGPQTSLDLYLQENGITSLFFGGVNADQVRTTQAFSLHVAFRHPRVISHATLLDIR